MLRGMRAEAVLSALIALALSGVQWWPAFRNLKATGFGDWQMVHHHWEAARVAVQRFGEWPLWDPFFCGGIPILGNPESQLYAPLFWLTFLIGSVAAVKLFLLLHAACALLGMYWLARLEYGLHAGAAAFVAGAWGLSGCFAWDGAGGHATFLPFAFAPWLVLCFRRSERPAFLVATAGLLVLTLLEGGTYPFPYFVLLLAFELGLKLLQGGARGAALRAAAQIGGLTALAGAIRLLPIALELGHTPRAVESVDALDWRDVWLMLTARSHEWRFAPHPYVWPEYGSYVGYSVLALAALGAAASMAQRVPRHLVLGLLLFGLLMLGSPAPYYPWALLHQLPVYDSLRVPSRFAVLVTFYLALLAGHALQLLLSRLPLGRFALPAVALAVVAQCADMLAVTAEIVDRWRGPPLSGAAPEPDFHVVHDRSYGFAYASYPRLHVGTLACYSGAMDWHASPALWIGRRPQARVAGGRGRVLSSGLTTRRVFADVELPEPGRVVFNQNHAPGWSASTGSVQQDRGRLALDLPAGRRRIELIYAPPVLRYAAALSALGVGLMLWLLRRGRATLPAPAVLHPVAARAPADASDPIDHAHR